MTVTGLYKLLAAAIATGHGRAQVAVDKTAFQDNRESDGCTILSLSGIEIGPVAMADDDGGIAVNKDGTERYRKTCVLYGSMGCGAFGSAQGSEHG
ncbi:MAG: hypothetical protein KGL39_15455 [Patescibacteria group bacterium]|nr:hypothetical protein [Patescibacteria group bacterium]